MRSTFLSLLVALLALLAGCGAAEPTAVEAAEEEKEAYDPDALQYTTGEYELAPGEERYVCYVFDIPAEGIGPITRIHPAYGRGVHHTFFAYVLGAEPEKEFECPVLFKVTWVPLYLGGVESDPLDMPEGSAVRVPTKQLILQLHLQNTSAETIRDRTTVHVSVEPERDDLVAAGIFGLDNRAIDIAAGEQGATTSMECAPGRDMQVFGVLGHMHKLGTHLELAHAGGAALYSAAWSFDDQPVEPVSFSVAKGDKLRLTCTHSNPTSESITWGESSDTEMCAIVLYYTPFDELDGCIANP